MVWRRPKGLCATCVPRACVCTHRRTAASAYAEQTRSAIAAVQREYGLPAPGSGRNVFSWSRRPDVRAVSGIMCGYIKEWDYRQVRKQTAGAVWWRRSGCPGCVCVCVCGERAWVGVSALQGLSVTDPVCRLQLSAIGRKSELSHRVLRFTDCGFGAADRCA